MSNVKSGSCFCGQNKFEVSADAVDNHHCHCSICRRLQGAPYVTLAIFPKSSVKWTKGGDLQTFDSSETVHRHRCKNCGTPMTISFEGHAAFGDLVAFSRTTFDAGVDTVNPKAEVRHAFWCDRAKWAADIKDELKKVDGFA